MAAKVVWAIDIGQTAVRAVKAAAAGDRIEILAFDSIIYKDMLSAPGVDRDSAIQQALRSLVARNNLGSAAIAAAIPGQSALVRFIKLPPVEKKRIPDIVRYEAHQQIPFPLEEVVWAYKPMEKGFQEGEQVEVGIFAMRRDIVNRFLSNLMVCGIDVDVLQLAPMALYNLLAFDQPPGQEATLLLDVGAENTELLLATETSVWPRSLPVAGNDMTQAIMEKFKVPFDKAETLKRMAKQSKYSTQIYHAIEPVLKRFVEEIQRSLGFYRSINPGVRISGILTLGGAFRLPGMAKYISENLRLPIQSYTEPQNFDLHRARNPRVFQEDPVGFGVALGLAVQALGYGAMDTSLLPPEVLHRKLISRKKPYAAAVAVMSVLALGTAMLNTYQEGKSLEAANRKEARDVRDQLDRDRAAYQKNLEVAPIRTKLEQASSLWSGRDLQLKVVQKVIRNVRQEPENEQGIWLIKVMTQQIPFRVAVESMATAVPLDSGLKGPPKYEDDTRFTDDLAARQRTATPLTFTTTPTATRPEPAKAKPEEDVSRVVGVGETTHPNEEAWAQTDFINKILEDGEGPKFINGVMLRRDKVSKWIGPDGLETVLDTQTEGRLREITEAERKKAAGEPLTASERELPTMVKFLDELKRKTGIHQDTFVQFTASFFVDPDGYVAKSVEERKEALKKEQPVGGPGHGTGLFGGGK